MGSRLKGLIIILAVLLVLLVAGVIGLEVFKINSISVQGNERYTKEEIIALSGIEYYTNIFMLDEAKVEESLNSDRYIVYDGIERNYPDAITININERKPICMVEAVSYTHLTLPTIA